MLISKPLDDKILVRLGKIFREKQWQMENKEYTKEKKIRYTRYADDMTFSGDFEPGEVIHFVKQNLKLLNLKINKEKTRTRRKNQLSSDTL